jgi:hypothetical protein
VQQQRKPGSWDERAWWAKQLGSRADGLDMPGSEEPSAATVSDELAEKLVAALDRAQAVVEALLAEVRRLPERVEI